MKKKKKKAKKLLFAMSTTLYYTGFSLYTVDIQSHPWIQTE